MKILHDITSDVYFPVTRIVAVHKTKEGFSLIEVSHPSGITAAYIIEKDPGTLTTELYQNDSFQILPYKMATHK